MHTKRYGDSAFSKIGAHSFTDVTGLKKKRRLRLTPIDVPTLQILFIIGLNDVEILTTILSRFSKSEMSFTYFLKKDTINVLIESYV